MSSVKGYYGKLLFIDLSSGKIEKRTVPEEDLAKFIG